MTTESNGLERPRIVSRVVLCALVLGIGLFGMLALAAMKKPPAETASGERPIRVEVLRVAPTDTRVTIRGYGDASALDVVTLSAEVSGRITAVHPNLESGHVVPTGAVLLRIDDRDYRAGHAESLATVEQLRQTVLRLQKQFEIDRRRLGTLERSRGLARSEFERVRILFEADQVGTRSGVEAAERAYNTASDLADQTAQAVALYPLRIREAESSLAAAEARLDVSALRLERCVLSAPFTGRVRQVSAEVGRFVSSGEELVTLADDSVLEIHVPLDSRDARNWLPFDGRSSGDIAWFGALPRLECTVRWTEAPDTHYWTGTLDRVVQFDSQTRTVTVAVRVPAENAVAGGAGVGLPLVEGMFCVVEIPGRALNGVYRVPRHAVSYENRVYLSRGGRLKTVPVDVARFEGEDALIRSGLSEGDRVVVTRLVDPLENALLDIQEDGAS